MKDIYQVIHAATHENRKYSLRAIAQGISMSYAVLVSKTNPNCETHKLNVNDVMAICKFTGDASIIDCMKVNLSIDHDIDNSAEPLEALAGVTKELGDCVPALLEMAKGEISAKKQISLFRELSELKTAVETLLEACLINGKK